jgi:hypothetical protein
MKDKFLLVIEDLLVLEEEERGTKRGEDAM